MCCNLIKKSAVNLSLLILALCLSYDVCLIYSGRLLSYMKLIAEKLESVSYKWLTRAY